LGQLYKAGQRWTPEVVPAPLMREIVLGVAARDITGTTGKNVLAHMLANLVSGQQSTRAPAPTESTIAAGTTSVPSRADTRLADVLDALGLNKFGPDSAKDLQRICEQAVAALPDVVAFYKRGNEGGLARLVGQVMRNTQGTADAQKAKEILRDLLK
jgi:aspartyl-tRNA(Asn)/glutamyl-tRNA(Gln) amidotransferase subunit B